MPKASKGKKFYAVQKGHQTGVFLTWEDCQKQTKGYSGAKFQSFMNAADAEAFVSGTLSKDPGPSVPPTSHPSAGVTSDTKGKKRTMSRDATDESEYDVVYCDGACKGNGQAGSIAGVGVWWEENDPRNIAERCPGDQTNNRAELIAIVRMLETTPKSKRPLVIKTDSQYSIKCFFQWLPKWERNDFRSASGAPVKNAGIIKYVAALLNARALMGQPVRMAYVKGHSGDRGNDGADAQANIGTLLPPVPERDWTKAKQDLLARFEEERKLSEDQPTVVPLNVAGGELVQTNQPHKVRKVRHDLPFSRLPSSSVSTTLRRTRLKPPIGSSTARRSPSPSHLTSPPSQLPVVEVSSSPLQDTQVRLTPSPLPCKGDPVPPEPDNSKVKSSTLLRPSSPLHVTSLTHPLPITEISSSPLQDTESSQVRPVPSLPSYKADLAPLELENVKIASHVGSQSITEESFKSPKISVRKHGAGLFTMTPPPNAEVVKKTSPPPYESREAKALELEPQVEGKPKKPIVMSVDVADVNLDDYLDCVDDDDDPFDGL